MKYARTVHDLNKISVDQKVKTKKRVNVEKLQQITSTSSTIFTADKKSVGF